MFPNFLCSSHLWFVESFLKMDAFELLDFYVDGFAIVRLDNLVVDELENFTLSKYSKFKV